MLAISDSWSSASSFTAAGSRKSSGDSHPVSVADRCSGDQFLRSERVSPRFSAMTSFSSTSKKKCFSNALRHTLFNVLNRINLFRG